MINQINIRGTATFGNTLQTLDDLKKFNYFFGANGSGKTTISKVIANSTQFSDCGISWERDLPMEICVYNRDFVEHNFSQQSPLKGVFTLGEKETDTLSVIEATKSDIDKLVNDIKNLTTTLQGADGNGGKKHELSQLEAKYCNLFWLAKQKHDAKLSGGFKGFRDKKDSFKNKVLSESSSNTSELLPLADLEEKAGKVFSDDLVVVDSILTIQPEKLLSLENAPILGKRVVGKEDIDIAAIIQKLDNSDWVRQGLSYYKVNDGVCPFCQQKTDLGFAKSLNEYFDETFERNNADIKNIISDYSTESNRIQQQVQAIIDLRSEFIDNVKLESEKKLLDSNIEINIQKLAQKKKEASHIIELNSLSNIFDAIIKIIESCNVKINKHNAIISNIKNEKDILTSQIWRLVIDELKTEISEYYTNKANITSAIDNLEAQLRTKNGDKRTKEDSLRDLEKQIVSIQPTLDGMNSLLTSFGFQTFSLAKGKDGRTYKLVRANGADAHDTLSEGERNFVTFLYFYYLLKGSQSENGMTTDKIVVFDDPVSSLDSDVLFIVSILLRELFKDVRQNKGTIKQIFVLTHNIYFHKEVTFNSNRKKNKLLREESFWLVKKHGADSIVERQISNPIKTSYELLWEEVRTERRNNATIQNTLRRILENYFKLLGRTPLDTLYTKFEGNDKIKCQALCSWVNDGSHSVFNDDHYTALDDTNVELYLQVFKQIFDQCGHIAHYNMMMDITT
jgi:wobble nucleotide-excising tRNase